MTMQMRLTLTRLISSALIAFLLSDGTASHSSTLLDNKTRDSIVISEFIFDKAPFPSCHASTVVETTRGLVAAWFGGTRERNPDVGIWVARRDSKGWSAPAEAANGIQTDGKRYPCWNPVLFQPDHAPLMLFYKVGPSPSEWWGMLITSTDAGATWSKPRRLPDGFLGPIKDKPIRLKDGSIICGSSTENAGWLVHMEFTDDAGVSWRKSEPLNDRSQFGAIQPTILVHRSGAIQILCRSRQKRITESWSTDGGKTWSRMKTTPLPNPSAGIDAVMLRDGRALVVYNHTETARSPLNIVVSDEGKIWKAALVLEDQPGEYSYPAIIQTTDGLVHVTYTWRREKIKHVVIDPRKLIPREMPDGHWPE